MKRYFTLTTALAALSMGQLSAQVTKVSIQSSHETVTAGSTFDIALTLQHEADHWSYYNASTSGVPSAFSLSATEGVEVGIAQLPKPYATDKTGENKLSFLFNKETTALFKVNVPSDFSESSISLSGSVFSQMCTEGTCKLPSTLEKKIEIKVADEVSASNAAKVKELTSKASKLTNEIRLAVSNTDDTVTFTFLTELPLSNVDDLYFTDPNSIAEPVVSQTFSKVNGGYELTLPRRKNLLDEVVKISDEVTGVLFSTSGDILGEPSFIVSTAEIPSVESTQSADASRGSSEGGFLHSYRTFTVDDKAAHAKLYNPTEKIKYVSLSKARELDISKANSITSGDSSTGSNETFISAAFFAFIGGMILNLMPCVFPVLGLKVMGFAQMAGNDPKKIKAHGLVFTLGVVISMWILAITILLIKSAIAKSGDGAFQWGGQMQNPVFLGLIILLLFIMGLNMYGVFEIGTNLTSAGGKLQNKKGYSGSFFSGVLTTLIATPCSGPFLGAAMSYTLGLPAFQAMIIFTIFALGISFPYLLLAFIPALINKLPKPGAWMEVLKKSMAFPLFATAVFFMATFGKITGLNGLYWLSMAMVIYGFAAWVYGTWSNPFISKTKRYVFGYGLSAIAVTGAAYMTYTAMTQVGEKIKGWHPGVVEHHLSKKRIVWVDYTADW